MTPLFNLIFIIIIATLTSYYVIFKINNKILTLSILIPSLIYTIYFLTGIPIYPGLNIH